jgi:hypothetical protein
MLAREIPCEAWAKMGDKKVTFDRRPWKDMTEELKTEYKRGNWDCSHNHQAVACAYQSRFEWSTGEATEVEISGCKISGPDSDVSDLQGTRHLPQPKANILLLKLEES